MALAESAKGSQIEQDKQLFLPAHSLLFLKQNKKAIEK